MQNISGKPFPSAYIYGYSPNNTHSDDENISTLSTDINLKPFVFRFPDNSEFSSAFPLPKHKLLAPNCNPKNGRHLPHPAPIPLTDALKTIAVSTNAGISVNIPASKFRLALLFMPKAAPVKFAEPRYTAFRSNIINLK